MAVGSTPSATKEEDHACAAASSERRQRPQFLESIGPPSLSQTRLPKGPGGETQLVTEDGAWCSGAGNRSPSARRLRPYHRGGHRREESLQSVCKEAPGPLRETLQIAMKQTIFGGHPSTLNMQISTAMERNKEEEEEKEKEEKEKRRKKKKRKTTTTTKQNPVKARPHPCKDCLRRFRSFSDRFAIVGERRKKQLWLGGTVEQQLEMYRASKPALRKALLRWLPSKNKRKDSQRRFEEQEARQAPSHDWKDGAQIGEADDPGPAKKVRGSKEIYIKTENQPEVKQHTIRMKSAPWANPPGRNHVLPASGDSVTYRDVLISRGGRLALPVRGARFCPPLRYLGRATIKLT